MVTDWFRPFILIWSAPRPMHSHTSTYTGHLPLIIRSLIIEQSPKRLTLTTTSMADRRPVFIILQVEMQSAIFHYTKIYIYISQWSYVFRWAVPLAKCDPTEIFICWQLTQQLLLIDVNVLRTLGSRLCLSLSCSRYKVKHSLFLTMMI